MATVLIDTPQIVMSGQKFICKALGTGRIKTEAVHDVTEFVQKLNQIRNSLIDRYPMAIYIFALGFIVSFVAAGFAHKNKLFIIPLVFLVLFVISSMIVCFRDAKIKHTTQRIIEEYRIKLAPHYVVMDRSLGHVVTPYGRYEFREAALLRNSIKLVPIEQAFRIMAPQPFAQSPVQGIDPYFQQEQVALYEQAQINREIPIYQLNIDKQDQHDSEMQDQELHQRFWKPDDKKVETEEDKGPDEEEVKRVPKQTEKGKGGFENRQYNNDKHDTNSDGDEDMPYKFN